MTADTVITKAVDIAQLAAKWQAAEARLKAAISAQSDSEQRFRDRTCIGTVVELNRRCLDRDCDAEAFADYCEAASSEAEVLLSKIIEAPASTIPDLQIKLRVARAGFLDEDRCERLLKAIDRDLAAMS
ncbi:MAG: hypothetical protein VX871_12690 [Pseudomonadota bacterium]|nr:hypothetical protein [Pseudomonadota bacterium]